MKTIKHYLIILFSISIAACSGGGSTSSSTPTAPNSTSLTGNFVDAPLKGVQYTATPSGLSGITDANGNYTYQAGDTVTFSIPNAAGLAVQLGSTTPTTPTSGGNATTFVLNMPNGNQIAQVAQALNHSTSANTLDLSGISLNSTNTAVLNTYIATNGNVLPGGADPTVTTNVTNTLAAVQSAAAFTSGATPTTPVTSSFIDTVTTNLTTAISNIASTGLTIPLTTKVPGGLVFVTSLTSNNPIHQYNIHYYNPNGSLIFFTGSSPAPSQKNNYPNITWSLPSSPNNTITMNYAGYTLNNVNYPTLVQTTTITYDDATSSLSTWSVSNTAIPPAVVNSGSSSTVALDTTFGQSYLAGKTFTLNMSAGGSCPNGQTNLVFNNAGSSANMVCAGTTTVLSTIPVSSVSNVPGVVAIVTNPNRPTMYLGLTKGSTSSSGSFAYVQEATTATSNDGTGSLVTYTSK